jgi:hypothetical protein
VVYLAALGGSRPGSGRAIAAFRPFFASKPPIYRILRILLVYSIEEPQECPGTDVPAPMDAVFALFVMPDE